MSTDPVLPAGRADWPKVCAAVIPCLNEAGTIHELVRRVVAHLPTVFVVDDGSADGTSHQASAAGAKVFRHDASRGKGAALATGFQQARSHGFDWALTMDGDGQHAPEDIPAFLARAERTAAALVIGNRMPEAAKMPWLRRWVNRWMTRRLARMTRAELADSQCGFRLINLRAIAGMQLRTSHFEAESELLVACVRAGLKVEFVPVRVIYGTGKSHIRPLADAWRWLRWWRAQR